MRSQIVAHGTSCAPWWAALRGSQHSICAIPTKNIHAEFNHVEAADNPKLRDILQNNWPAFLKKNVGVPDDQQKKKRTRLKRRESCIWCFD